MTALRPAALFLLVAAAMLCGCRELQDLRRIKTAQDERLVELQKRLDVTSKELYDHKRRSVSETAALKKRLKTAEDELRKAQTRRSQRERELDRALAEARARVAELDHELQLSRQRVDGLSSDIDQRDAEAALLSQSLADTKAQLDELTDAKESVDQELARLQRSHETLARRLEAAQTDLTKSDKRVAELEKEIDAATKRAKVFGDNTKSLAAQIANLQDAMRESDDLTKEKETENEQAVIDLRKQAMRLQEQLKKMRSGEVIMDADLEDAYNLLRTSLKPVSDADFATVTTDRRGVVVRLSADYLFQKDVIDLDPSVLPTLDQIAQVLSRFPNKFVEVQGHTDAQALVNMPFADNWALGSARADKVVRYLAQQTQLDPTRLKSSTCSQYRPLSKKDSTPAQRRLDRRVEIILTAQP